MEGIEYDEYDFVSIDPENLNQTDDIEFYGKGKKEQNTIQKIEGYKNIIYCLNKIIPQNKRRKTEHIPDKKKIKIEDICSVTDSHKHNSFFNIEDSYENDGSIIYSSNLSKIQDYDIFKFLSENTLYENLFYCLDSLDLDCKVFKHYKILNLIEETVRLIGSRCIFVKKKKSRIITFAV